MRSFATGLLCIFAAGCTPNSPPEILRMTAQEAYVGSPFEITLKAADPDGDSIEWSYNSPTLNLQGRAQLITLDREARFGWTPIAPDVGDHTVDFVASDGEDSDREPVSIRVKASTTSKTAPTFIKPLGEGLVLDLSKSKCVVQEVEVQDPDTAQVAFSLNPTVAGASLKSTGGLRAVLRWCPTTAQAANLRHLLGLVADDHDNPKVIKPFTVLLKKAASTTPCQGTSKCAAGKVCGSAGCVSDACVPKDVNGDKLFWEQSSCPSAHFCPSPGPGSSSSSHCAATCSKDSDCRSFERCKVFDTKSGCGKVGSASVGQPCTSFTSCAGIAMCLPWKGGYCTVSDCSSSGGFSGKCPSGSTCVPLPDIRFKGLGKHWVCLRNCLGDSGCRLTHGFKCKSLKDDKGKSVKVCR